VTVVILASTELASQWLKTKMARKDAKIAKIELEMGWQGEFLPVWGPDHATPS
jgi:hypothetical protein